MFPPMRRLLPFGLLLVACLPASLDLPLASTTLVTGPPARALDGGVCPRPDAGFACGVVPLAPLDTMCATPRAHREAEELARSMANAFIAPQGLYEQVDQALLVFRAQRPAYAAIWRRNAAAPSVSLELEPGAWGRLADGGEPRFDCLNATYRAVSTDTVLASNGAGFTDVAFAGQYDLQQLADEYATLPGVRSARPSSVSGDGPNLCFGRDGEGFFVLVDDASGACETGCLTRTERGFHVELDGGVTDVGEYDPHSGVVPAWRVAHPDCAFW